MSEEVGAEKTVADRENEAAQIEADKCQAIAKEVAELQVRWAALRLPGWGLERWMVISLAHQKRLVHFPSCCSSRCPQARCEAELSAAIPLVQQAERALDTLNKKDLGAVLAHIWLKGHGKLLGLSCWLGCARDSWLGPLRHHAAYAAGEMKSLKKPPPGVDDITAVVLCLLESNPKDKSWAAAVK